MITVTVNGKRYDVPAGQPLDVFIKSVGLVPSQLVVERNSSALTPAEAREVSLEDGDVLEIVRIVAGG